MSRASFSAMLVSLWAYGCTSLPSTPKITTEGGPAADAGPVATVMILATGLDHPRGIAIDDAYVYVAVHGPDNGSGSVVRIPKAGGTTMTLATGLSFAEAVAVDESYVYVTHGAGIGRGGSMSRVLKTGMGMARLFTAPGMPGQIVADTDAVYWTTLSEHSVWRLMKASSSAAEWHRLSTTRPLGISVDSTYVYFTRVEGGPARKIKTANPLDPHEELISRSSTSTEGIFLVASQRYVFWGEHKIDGTMWRSSKVPSNPLVSPERMQSDTYFHGIAVDSSNVYWIRGSLPSTIVRASADGSGASDLHTSINHGWGIAVDSTSVYWSQDNGTVARAPR